MQFGLLKWSFGVLLGRGEGRQSLFSAEALRSSVWGPRFPTPPPPLRNPPQAFRCFAKESCAASRYPEFDTRGFRSCAHACAYTTLQLHFLLSVCHFRYRGTVATSPGLFRKGLRLVKIPLGLFHRAASKCRNALKCTHRVDTADR